MIGDIGKVKNSNRFDQPFIWSLGYSCIKLSVSRSLLYEARVMRWKKGWYSGGECTDGVNKFWWLFGGGALCCKPTSDKSDLEAKEKPQFDKSGYIHCHISFSWARLFVILNGPTSPQWDAVQTRIATGLEYSREYRNSCKFPCTKRTGAGKPRSRMRHYNFPFCYNMELKHWACRAFVCELVDHTFLSTTPYAPE